MRPASTFAICLLLAACAPRIDGTQQAETQLIGTPKWELMACAGTPDRTKTAAGKEHLTYIRTEKHNNVTFSCRAEFILYRGEVEHVSYDGIDRPLLGPVTPCANIVRQCLK